MTFPPGAPPEGFGEEGFPPPLPGPLIPSADEAIPGPGEEMAFDDPDPRWRTDFYGLLYLGALRARFSWLGHVFRIRTLRSDEELIVAELGKTWAETMGGARAHAIAMVALSVESVDGQPLPSPLGEQDAGGIGWAEQRFRYAGRWYAYTIDHVFSRYLELEARVRTVMDELGKESAPMGPEPVSTSISTLPPDVAS